ncbi:MAG: M23 family metallopeptidase [Acidobacteriota bacterium]
MAHLAVLLLVFAAAAQGVEISRLETGLAAEPGACRLSRRASSVQAGDPQILVRFTARASAGESMAVEWVSPAGSVAQSTEYANLPPGRTVCVVNALQIGGFPPATQPGRWRVRVMAGGRVAGVREFDILGRPTPLAVRVSAVGPGGLLLDTVGAEPDTTVNIARYREGAGWDYVAVVLASQREGGRLRADPGPLEPGEYLVILRNPNGDESPPARFVVASSGAYRRPFPEDETWRVTQRPYGAFSHYGRALHAWDFAPVEGRFVTAMRGGVVLARDLRLGQTADQRLFGNYITIRHGDGTYAHYAHLKSGSFRVRTGQKVEAGQILAEAGNSGYSFGRHVHVHVTRSPSITAPSVPFQFQDGASGPVLTSAAPSRKQWEGAAGFAQWWTRLLRVPRNAGRLAVQLECRDSGAELDLWLVSPTGEWIRADGPRAEVQRPRPGRWRVAVQSVRGEAAFRVEPEITPSGP